MQQELRRYFEWLFKSHARLLIIRLDLSYSEAETCKHHEILLCRDEQKHLGLFDEIISHREQFIKHVRTEQPLHGYAWKFEYGPSKGFHYHVILLIDGSKAWEDISIGKELGDEWKSNITAGRGLYFNCNAKKKSYRQCAVGMHHFSEPDLWDSMSQVAGYLTKMDLYARLILPGNRRTFGRGEITQTPAIKRGRPRQRLLNTEQQPLPSPSKFSVNQPDPQIEIGESPSW